jgi:hypothetical protein
MKKLDGRLKVCFMTATYQNYEALRAAFPTTEIECYIQKPVEIKDLGEKNKCRVTTIIIVLAVSLIVIIIINYRGKL